MKKYLLIPSIVAFTVLLTGCGGAAPAPVANGVVYSYTATSNVPDTQIYCGFNRNNLQLCYTTPFSKQTRTSLWWSNKYFQGRKDGYIDSEIIEQPYHPTVAKLHFNMQEDTRSKAMKEAYSQAQLKNTISGYESFIATYPDAPQVSSARNVIAAKKEANRNNPELQKKILDNIMSYLKKKDIGGLLNYANSNADVMDFAQTQPKISLLFSGPTELQVGKILQYKKQGVSDGVLAAKINTLNKPYKKFSLEEITELMELGVTDKLLMAMLNVTAACDKEHRQLVAQENMLKAQERIAKDNKSTTTTVYQTAQPTQTVQQESGIGDKIVEKVAEKAIEGLIRNLF